MHPNQKCEDQITAKVDRFWQDRALDMFRTLTSRNGDVPAYGDNMRISANWPQRGSISFDLHPEEHRVYLRMNKKGFHITHKAIKSAKANRAKLKVA